MMGKSVLVFDDDEDILSILIYLLEEKGWKISTRTTCANILADIEETRPDVILMDNWIPESGGKVATQLIKNHSEYKHIPVIYFSANNDVEKLAKEAGADTHLAKPFDLDQLEHLLVTIST
ncbi:response regulator [Pedobacter sp. P351]|uniref:response regulator n=1 Tax=Pedobacter superstes TaxID=3133441 RepID=UPI0030B638AA